ncbi:hypothetical protein [Mycoplasma nasistruthionis]|uniref:ECM-binding protein homolog n=1 Tax=Mycoplasma nasistruthionis TaxID=353852 RepID=A0A4Y6I6A7_9MOLU|nr:hypothetical protein [Mycoplasma nasistruthionis]QDF64902.1 hypothetical protein FIV53_01070 [Mycoplasma nasistruthionis]
MSRKKLKKVAKLALVTSPAMLPLAVLSANESNAVDLNDPNISSVQALKTYLQEKKFTYQRRTELGGLRQDQIDVFIQKIDNDSANKSGDELKRTLASIKQEIDAKYKFMVKWYNTFLNNSLGDPMWTQEFRGFQAETVNGIQLAATGSLIGNNIMYYSPKFGKAKTVAENFVKKHFRSKSDGGTGEDNERANDEETFKQAILAYRTEFDSKIFEGDSDRQKVLDRINVIRQHNWDMSSSETDNDEVYSKTGGIGRFLLTYLGTRHDWGDINDANRINIGVIDALKRGVNFWKSQARPAFINNFGEFANNAYRESNLYKNSVTLGKQSRINNAAYKFNQLTLIMNNPLSMNYGDSRFDLYRTGQAANIGLNYIGELRDPYGWASVAGENRQQINAAWETNTDTNNEKENLIKKIGRDYQYIGHLKTEEGNAIRALPLLTDVRAYEARLRNLNERQKLKIRIDEATNFKQTEVYQNADPAGKAALDAILPEANNLFNEMPIKRVYDYTQMINRLEVEFNKVKEPATIAYQRQFLLPDVDNLALTDAAKNDLRNRLRNDSIGNWNDYKAYVESFKDLKTKIDQVDNFPGFDQTAKDTTNAFLVTKLRDDRARTNAYNLAVRQNDAAVEGKAVTNVPEAQINSVVTDILRTDRTADFETHKLVLDKMKAAGNAVQAATNVPAEFVDTYKNRINKDNTNNDAITAFMPQVDSLWQELNSADLTPEQRNALNTELSNMTNNSGFDAFRQKLAKEVAKKALLDKLNEAKNYKQQNMDVYNEATEEQKRVFDEAIANAQAAVDAADLKSVDEFNSLKSALETSLPNVSDPVVANQLKDNYKTELDGQNATLNQTQIDALKQKLTDTNATTADVKATKTKIDELVNKAKEIKALTNLSEDQKVKEIQKLVDAYDNSVAEITDLALAKKKDQVLGDLQAEVKYPNLEKSAYEDRINNATSVSELETLEIELANQNKLKDLEEKIKQAEKHLADRLDKFNEVDTDGKNALQTLIDQAKAEVAKGQAAGADSFNNFITSLDNKINELNDAHLVTKLKEKLNNEVATYTNELSSKNISALQTKINTPSDYDAVKAEFEKAKKVKEKAAELNNLNELFQTAILAAKDALVDNYASDDKLNEIATLASAKNQVLTDFNTTYPDLNKDAKRSEIENAVDNSALEVVKTNLEKENAKAKDKAEEFVVNNQELYNSADPAKRADFDAKLQAVKDTLNASDLKDKAEYERLENELNQALEQLSEAKVLEYLKDKFSKEIDTFNPPFTADQINTLKAKINDNSVNTVAGVKDLFEQIKALKDNANTARNLSDLSDDAKNKTIDKLITHLGDQNAQQQDLDLANAKNSVLKDLKQKTKYPNLDATDYQSRLEAIDNQNDLNDFVTELVNQNKLNELQKLVDKAQNYLNDHSSDLDKADLEGKNNLQQAINNAKNAIAQTHTAGANEFENQINSLQNALDAVSKDNYLAKLRDKLTKQVELFDDVLAPNNIRDLVAKINDSALDSVDSIIDAYNKALKVKEKAEELKALNDQLSENTIQAAIDKLVANSDNNDVIEKEVQLAKDKHALLRDFETNYPNLEKDNFKNEIEQLASNDELVAEKAKLDKLNKQSELDKYVKQVEQEIADNNLIYSLANPDLKTEFDNALKEAKDALAATDLADSDRYSDLKAKLAQKLPNVQEPAVLSHLRDKYKQEIATFKPEFDDNQIVKLNALIDDGNITKVADLQNVFNSIKALKEKANEVRRLSQIDNDTQNSSINKFIENINDSTAIDNQLELAKKQNQLLQNFDDNLYPFLQKDQYKAQIQSLDTLNKANELETTLADTNKLNELIAKKVEVDKYKNDNPNVIANAQQADRDALEDALNKAQEAINQGASVGKDELQNRITALNTALSNVSAEKVLRELKERKVAELQAYAPTLTEQQINELIGKIQDPALDSVEKVNAEFEKMQQLKTKADQIDALDQLSQEAKNKAKQTLLDNYNNPDNQNNLVETAKAQNELLKQLADSNWPNLNKDDYQNQIEGLNTPDAVEAFKAKLDSDNAKKDLDKLIREIQAYKTDQALVYDNASNQAKTDLNNAITQALNTTPENNLPSKDAILEQINNLKEAFKQVQRDVVTEHVRNQKQNQVDSFNNLSDNNKQTLKDQLNQNNAPTLEDILAKSQINDQINQENSQIHGLNNLSDTAKANATNDLINAHLNNADPMAVIELANAKDQAVATVKSYDANNVPTNVLQNFVNDIENANNQEQIHDILDKALSANNAGSLIKDSNIPFDKKQRFYDKISNDKDQNETLSDLINQINPLIDQINQTSLSQEVKDKLSSELFDANNSDDIQAVKDKLASELQKQEIQDLIKQIENYQAQNPNAYQYANLEAINNLKASLAIANGEIEKDPLPNADYLNTLKDDLNNAFAQVQSQATAQYLNDKLNNQINDLTNLTEAQKQQLTSNIDQPTEDNLDNLVNDINQLNSTVDNINQIDVLNHLTDAQKEAFKSDLIANYDDLDKQAQILALARAKNDLNQQINSQTLLPQSAKDQLLQQVQQASSIDDLNNNVKPNLENAKDTANWINSTTIPADKRQAFLDKVQGNNEPNNTLKELVDAVEEQYQNINTSLVSEQQKQALKDELLSLDTKQKVDEFANRLNAENEKVLLQELIDLVEAYPEAEKLVYDAADPKAKEKLAQVLQAAKDAVNATPTLTTQQLKDAKDALTEAFAGVERSKVTEYVRNSYQNDLENSNFKDDVKNALKDKISEPNAPSLEDLIEQQAKIRTIGEKIKFVNDLPNINDEVEKNIEKALLDAFEDPNNQLSIVTLANNKNATIDLINSYTNIPENVKNQLRASTLTATSVNPEIEKIQSDALAINQTSNIINDSKLPDDKKQYFFDRVSTNLINNAGIEQLVQAIDQQLDKLTESIVSDDKKAELKAKLLASENLTQVQEFAKLLEVENEKVKLQNLMDEINQFIQDNPLDYENADPAAKEELTRLMPLAQADLDANPTKEKSVYTDHINKLKEQFAKLQSDAVIKFVRDKLTKQINDQTNLSDNAKQALLAKISPENAPKLQDLVNQVEKLNKTIDNLNDLTNTQLNTVDKNNTENQLLDSYSDLNNQDTIMELAKAKHDLIQQIDNSLVGKNIKPELIKELRDLASSANSSNDLNLVKQQLSSVLETENAIKESNLPDRIKQELYDRISSDIDANKELLKLLENYVNQNDLIESKPLPREIKDQLLDDIVTKKSDNDINDFVDNSGLKTDLVEKTYPNVPNTILDKLSGSDTDVAIADYLNKLQPSKLNLKELDETQLSQLIDDIKASTTPEIQNKVIEDLIKEVNWQKDREEKAQMLKENTEKVKVYLWLALLLTSLFTFIVGAIVFIFKKLK